MLRKNSEKFEACKSDIDKILKENQKSLVDFLEQILGSTQKIVKDGVEPKFNQSTQTKKISSLIKNEKSVKMKERAT